MKKTTAPHELWQTCLYWMTATGNPVNKKYCRQQITTHPDYPALTAVVDFLEEGNMRYTAAQADASYIHEMNYPLLAHIKVPGNEYMHIISKAADWDVQKDITRHWSGVVLFAETDSHWQNAENEKYNRQQKANKVYLAAVFTALATLSIFTIAKIPAFSFALFGLLSLAGLLLSILITGSELGVQNNLVKQVCGAVSKSGCDAVLKTKFAKGFAGLTTGDYATLYFSSQFIAYIGSSFYLTLYTSLLWIALPGIVVAAASIYTQAMLIKQWCALCLALVSVLLLQFAIAVYALPNTGALISWHSLATFAGITMLLYLVLLPIKKILKTNHTQEQQVAELKKWKMDVGLFISQWQSEQQIDEKLWQNELIFGKIDAPLRIIVACNPYCGPCASEHLHLEQILERYPDKVSLAIRFLCHPEDEMDKQAAILASFLQLKSSLTTKQLLRAIGDWFKVMDYQKWNNMWPNTNTINVQEDLLRHRSWFTDSRIRATPTLFINSKKMPGRYSISDFKLLIPSLATLITETKNNLVVK